MKEPLAVRKLVGLVSDETSESQSAWTAREYLSYFARIRHMPNPEEEVERILDDVGLDAKFRGKLIRTYSTGMKRRVEIARALMGRPKVLFLDEPTRGLDLPAKRDMWGLLRRLAAAEKVTAFPRRHRKRHDLPQQPRLARDSQSLHRDQRHRQRQAGLHGCHA